VATAKISRKGWVVIPVEFRRRYGLKPGDTITVVDYGGVLALLPSLDDPVHEAQGMLEGSSLTKALLEEKVREREREG
jgi:AbrB family looped-hinge helix DNA binding protein